VPLFYDRDQGGLPRRWIARMKNSIGALCHFFNTHRMVQEYTERFYLPSSDRFTAFMADEISRAKELAEWEKRVQTAWSDVRIEKVETGSFAEIELGQDFQAQVQVHLGNLSPDDVIVELYLGQVDASGNIIEGDTTPMEFVQMEGNNHLFQADVAPCCSSGLHGYTIRVRPHHPDMLVEFMPGLLSWA
jgi:starch phosphorylase